MMQESFFSRFSRRVALEAEHRILNRPLLGYRNHVQPGPHPPAFMFEDIMTEDTINNNSSNEANNDLETGMSECPSISSPPAITTTEPAEEWQQQQQQRRCRDNMVFLAKVCTLGVFFFGATVFVANLVVWVGEVLVGDYHSADAPVAQEQPLTLSLILDEATAERISSMDHLEEILGIHHQDPSEAFFVWPQPSQDSNDDDDDALPPAVAGSTQSHIGQYWRAVKLHISGSNMAAAAAILDRFQPAIWNDDVPSEGGRGRERELSSSSSTAWVNEGVTDSEKTLLSLLEASICEKIRQAFPNFLPDTVDRICRLQYSPQQDAEGSILTAKKTAVLGHDRDEHGCIASAGYTWCQTLNQCHRPWETPCGTDFTQHGDAYAVEEPVLGNDLDEHGCDRSAGYSWNEASNSCQRAWETSDDAYLMNGDTNFGVVEGKPLLGNDRDEHGCDASAGYSWCETTRSCFRGWETNCGVDVAQAPLLGNDRDEHGCDASAGYSWCGASQSCHREWESPCRENANRTETAVAADGVDVVLTVQVA